jgi:hypothetical protein
MGLDRTASRRKDLGFAVPNDHRYRKSGACINCGGDSGVSAGKESRKSADLSLINASR